MRLSISKRMTGGILAAFTLSAVLCAQEFKIGKYDVQAHGFGTQGYVKTNVNNWLTMNTSDNGSGAFTDAACRCPGALIRGSRHLFGWPYTAATPAQPAARR